MTTRKPSISEHDVETLLRASPPVERAPSWLAPSTMDRIARTHKAHATQPANSTPPSSSLGGASIFLRLAPLAAAAAILALSGFLILPALRAPAPPPQLAITPDNHTDASGPGLASPATLEAFRTLRTLAHRADTRTETLVRTRVEEPLLREARLVAQDSEKVARAVLARLPIPSTLN
ncbi:MAG: hypothetical protein AB7G17_04500 [Phycisphaerales bacterium]